MERKGGGARRGPFAGKREPFATRLTPETMDELTSAAAADGLSISQKAEELIAIGLKARRAFDRELGPALQAFTDLALMAITQSGGLGPGEDKDVSRKVLQAAETLLKSVPVPAAQSPAPSTEPQAGGSDQTKRARRLTLD
jgi:hypothetical protein